MILGCGPLEVHTTLPHALSPVHLLQQLAPCISVLLGGHEAAVSSKGKTMLMHAWMQAQHTHTHIQLTQACTYNPHTTCALNTVNLSQWHVHCILRGTLHEQLVAWIDSLQYSRLRLRCAEYLQSTLATVSVQMLSGSCLKKTNSAFV